MSLTLVLALQTVAVATPAATAPPPSAGPRWAMPALIASAAPLDFDLMRYTSASGRCPGGGGADVLVCGPGRSGGAYPLARWARIFGPERPIRAEMNLGGNVQGRVYTEAVAMPRGAVSNRVLVGIRTAF